MHCIWHIHNSGILTTFFIYSGIFRLIQAYSEPCVTLTYSQPCHIPSPGIFRIRGIFKSLWNYDQACWEPSYSQNSLFRHYSTILRHMQTFCNSQICRNLAYLESCNIQNPSIIASWCIFRTLLYLQKFRTLTYW